MAKISICFFNLHLFKTELDPNKKKPQDKQIPPSEINLCDCLYSYLNGIEKYQVQEKEKRVYRVKYLEKYESVIDGVHNFYRINSIIYTGPFGEDGEAVDKDHTTSEPEPFGANKALAKPYGFSIIYNKKSKQALVIAQYLGNKSIVGQLKIIISDALRELDPSLSYKINPFIPADYFSVIFDEKSIYKLHVTTLQKKENHSLDETDAIINGEYHEPISEKTEHIYFTPKHTITDKLKNLFSKPDPQNSIIEISDFIGINSDSEEVDNIKVDFKDQTLNFSRMSSVRISNDISNEIELKANSSHPTESSLFNAMINHAMPYLKFFDISCDNIEKEDRQNTKVNNFIGNVKNDDLFSELTPAS